MSGRLQDKGTVVVDAARGIGATDDVACPALLPASDEARFINAADILADVGRSQIRHD
jgi:hypothetical protein